MSIKKIIPALIVLGSLFGCQSDADVASHNISKSADNYYKVK